MSDEDEIEPGDEVSAAGDGAAATRVYDQAFFLALARPSADTDAARAEARERWNAWRRDPANADVSVTFEGVDFRTEENRGISFAGFEFGDWAQFIGTTFDRGALFEGATFGALAMFTDATFDDGASFDFATFGDRVWFEGATFGDSASFAGATFGDRARFEGATFGDRAWFEGATFDDWASFAGATFGDRASFDGATGERDVEARRKGWAELDEAERARREKTYREHREAEGIGPAKFSEISFASARFRGVVSFARRSFERSADFTGVRFDRPPDFDGATNLQRIDFTGVRVGFAPDGRRWWKPDWTKSSSVATRLRALRSQIEATKNHDFERDLYIEERKAERGVYFHRYRREGRWGAFVVHCLWILVMALYWALSDYGRSWLRPAVWLGVVVLVFHGVGPVDGLTARSLLVKRAEIVQRAEAARPGRGAEIGEKWDEAAKLYAVANSIPFVGPLTIDGEVKKFLFCGEPARPAAAGPAAAKTPEPPPCVPLPPASLQIATILQNLLSILLVFFIGLAMRNYFRVK